MTNPLEMTDDQLRLFMGERLRLARQSYKLQQHVLGDRLEMCQTSISALENGKREMSVVELVHLAITLQRPILYFFPPQFSLSSELSCNELFANLPTLFQSFVVQHLSALVALNQAILSGDGDLYEDDQHETD